MNELHIDKTHWKKYRFDEVCRQVNEATKDPVADGLDHVVGLEHIEPNNLHITQWDTLEKETTFTRKFKKGQVLFGRRRAYQRKVAYAEFDGICSGDILVFEAIEDVLLPELLPFLIQSEGFFQKALATSAGSLSPRTKFKELADYEFLLPPKAEQKRLAELLWAADEVVEKEKRERDILQNQIQIYINENCNAIGQPKIPFSDLVDVNPTTKFDENEVSLITMPDVSEEGEIMHQEKVVPSDYKNKGLTPFQENDILFAKITPCMENGKGAIARDLINGWGLGSTEFHVLRPKSASDLYFCYYLTMSKRFRKLAEKQMTGSAGQKRVQVEFFDFYKLCAPSKEERKTIGEKLFKMDCCISALKQQISLSQQIKQELINKMF